VKQRMHPAKKITIETIIIPNGEPPEYIATFSQICSQNIKSRNNENKNKIIIRKISLNLFLLIKMLFFIGSFFTFKKPSSHPKIKNPPNIGMIAEENISNLLLNTIFFQNRYECIDCICYCTSRSSNSISYVQYRARVTHSSAC